MKIRIAGEQIQEMAADEILNHVSAAAYKRIKEADPKPTFRAYCIAHEGVSSGKVLGMGGVLKRWAHSAIENINKKLSIGTKIFHLHGENTNDHDGRRPIGEVVGKTLSDIAGKLSAVALTYIYPAYRDIPLNVPSIEADITMPESIDPDAQTVDVDVEEITGIALGNSEIVKPGFAGATLLAALQEFAENASYEINRSKGDETMTLDELKKSIKEGHFSPSDIFSDEEISNDALVRSIAKGSQKAEWEHRVRTDEKFKAESAKWEQEKKDLQAKLDAASLSLLKIKAAESLKSTIATRKLDEKQAAFVTKNAAKFAPKSEDTLSGDLNAFIDTQLDELKGFSEIFGLKSGEPASAGIGAGKSASTSADEDLLTPDALKDKSTK